MVGFWRQTGAPHRTHRRGRTSKENRLHLDFRPDDQDGEVDRFVARGATRVDVGQGSDTSWVVLADPEGNEFCVLGERHG